MVASLMKSRQISAVVVGADRVVANGDTANKIGTYQVQKAPTRFHPTSLIKSDLTSLFFLFISDRCPGEVPQRALLHRCAVHDRRLPHPQRREDQDWGKAGQRAYSRERRAHRRRGHRRLESGVRRHARGTHHRHHHRQGCVQARRAKEPQGEGCTVDAYKYRCNVEELYDKRKKSAIPNIFFY